MSRWDNFFTDLANSSPWLKMAAEGQAGTGKSFTLAQVAIGMHAFIKSDKPIVLFDTEKAGKFLLPLFKAAGIKVLVKESRMLSDLAATMDYCDTGEAHILIIDSITHVWENFLNAYQKQKGRKYLQFQDWGFIKPTWKQEYSDRLVNGRFHCLFTGREGFTYDHELNEDTGKKELVKTGVKMKVEGETAYEPDLLIRMERFERILDGDNKEVWREATVLKGRSQLLDGKTFKNPTFDDFRPELEFLFQDITDPADTRSYDDADLIESEDDNREERRQTKIQLERNNALLDQVASGTSKDAKALRLALMAQAYMGETSDTAIACMSLAQLEDSHGRLEPLVREIGHALRGEAKVYPVAKAVDAARAKHLDTVNLGEATIEQLQRYVAHMAKKVREKQKEGEAA